MLYLLLCLQNAGEESVSNLDKIRYANGRTPTADLRMNMQKVTSDFDSFLCTFFVQNHLPSILDYEQSLRSGIVKRKKKTREHAKIALPCVNVSHA